jgi:hypothetical protein
MAGNLRTSLAASYRRFTTWALQNIGYRDLTDVRACVFSGNHVGFRFYPPVREKEEPSIRFQQRRKEFLSRIPRGSTLSMSLALADEAYRGCGCTQRTAARLTLKELRSVQRFSIEHRQGLYKQMGISWFELNHSIGTSRRSHRTKRRKSILTTAEQQRMALTGDFRTEARLRNEESVRGLINRFCQKQQNFNQLFEVWWRCYVTDNSTDEWYQDNERGLKERFERMKQDPELSGSPWIAYLAGGLARMYWQFGRLAEAQVLYQSALDFWQTDIETWPQWHNLDKQKRLHVRQLKAHNVQQLQEALQDLQHTSC